MDTWSKDNKLLIVGYYANKAFAAITKGDQHKCADYLNLINVLCHVSDRFLEAHREDFSEALEALEIR